MRAHITFVSILGLGPLALACAPPSTVSDLGTTPTFGPGVSVRQEWKQPPAFTVILPQAAFLTLFVVSPNHGAELVPLAPADMPFAAGTHVLRPVQAEARRQGGPAVAGGTYPDHAAPCAVTDFVKETTQSTTGPGGVEQKTDVITFSTPTTSPPIVTCAVPGFEELGATSRPTFDRYLLVVATDKAVATSAIAGALLGLDVTGSPREVTERVATLAAREAGATQWGARAVRY